MGQRSKTPCDSVQVEDLTQIDRRNRKDTLASISSPGLQMLYSFSTQPRIPIIMMSIEFRSHCVIFSAESNSIRPREGFKTIVLVSPLRRSRIWKLPNVAQTAYQAEPLYSSFPPKYELNLKGRAAVDHYRFS